MPTNLQPAPGKSAEDEMHAANESFVAIGWTRNAIWSKQDAPEISQKIFLFRFLLRVNPHLSSMNLIRIEKSNNLLDAGFVLIEFT